MTTKHTHPVVFGRLVSGCARCGELASGAPKVQWRNQRAESERQRLADIRAHDCSRSRCGPVCTFGDW